MEWNERRWPRVIARCSPALSDQRAAIGSRERSLRGTRPTVRCEANSKVRLPAASDCGKAARSYNSRAPMMVTKNLGTDLGTTGGDWLFRYGELVLGPVPAHQIVDKLYKG